MNREYTREELRALRKKHNRIKRAKQLRRRVIFTIAAFIIVVVSTISFTSIKSKAQGSNETIKVKQYSSVMIPYGSTLSSIAADYIDEEEYESLEAYISEVMYINHLSDDKIQAGNYIIVPYFEEI